MEYASKGVAGSGLGLGIAGTALGVLNAGGLLGGVMGVGTNNYVTKDELKMSQELSSKDATIALLQSENSSEKKMVEVYTALAKQDKDIRAELSAFKDQQNAVNAAQGVANATMTSGIAINGTNIQNIQNTLSNITKCVVPNSSVCPGWGDVTVKPATT